MSAWLQAGQVVSTLNAQLDLPSRDDVRALAELAVQVLALAQQHASLVCYVGTLVTEGALAASPC